jgi:hypothetical protein
MKILLEDFSVKVGRIFKPIICNEGLHEVCNDKGVKTYILQLQKICQEPNIPTL